MRKTMRLKTPHTPVKQTNASSSLYKSALAVTYGTVDSNNNDGTCNILLVNGFVADKLRIPSNVFPSKDPTIGGITYPSVGAEVIIYHPIDDINSGFIYPAPLDFDDDTVVSDLLDQGDKTLLPGGWEYLYDQETGVAQFINGDFFNLTVDPDNESVSLVDFKENKITTDDAGILIEDKNGNTFAGTSSAWEINGNADFAVRFNALEIAVNNLVTSINSSVTGLIPAHTHIITAPGTPSGPGVGVAPTVVGDISASKVVDVKLP